MIWFGINQAIFYKVKNIFISNGQHPMHKFVNCCIKLFVLLLIFPRESP